MSRKFPLPPPEWYEAVPDREHPEQANIAWRGRTVAFIECPDPDIITVLARSPLLVIALKRILKLAKRGGELARIIAIAEAALSVIPVQAKAEDGKELGGAIDIELE